MATENQSSNVSYDFACLFSRHTQIANAAVTTHAAALIHIGIWALFNITFV
jgi:hypothetical protein